ncbi:tyrosine-type recombinase/integrase [Candidatus Micrarchaeota archaeon]|nr:tyrosine-type recombinase/integrase [Candidatus Micrarchaeota archaeon]
MNGQNNHKNMNDVSQAFSRLERDQAVVSENKELIHRFANTWLAKGVTNVRAVKLVYTLRKLAAILNKPFQAASKDDLITLVGKIEQSGYAENTKYDFKVVLKMFYRWLKGNDEENPPETKWLKPRSKKRGQTLPEQLLTEKEVLAMAQSAQHPRDKALIMVLYESGCRIGELLSLRMKNVEFDQYGAVLLVNGKTGHRRVRIISSAQVLSNWMEHYESTKDPEASLWPPRACSHHDTSHAADYRSIYKTLQNLAEKAGVKKKVYPHLFRHSRATALANKLTEAQMKEYFGWTQGSDMAATYVHLSGRDVDDALLALHDFGDQPKKKEKALELKTCLRCKERNAPSSKFCFKCGTPLDEAIAATLAPPKLMDEDLMRQLLEHPLFKEYLVEKALANGLVK